MWNRPGPTPQRKRKDREPPSYPAPALRRQPGPKLGSAEAAGGNRLLAGYLAHEYLTRGTLLGRPMGTAPETRLEQKPSVPAAEAAAEVSGTYVEVSQLLMCKNGAHVAGLVNPTQLAQWLRM